MTVAGHTRHRNTTRWKVVARKRGKTPPMQRLMPDSSKRQAERGVQPRFSKSFIFSGLVLAAVIMAAHLAIRVPATRQPAAPGVVPVRYDADPAIKGQAGQFKIVGGWTVHVDDPRFGGVSGLALDGDSLVALTDSGVVAYLPRPDAEGRARIRDLPDGPGDARLKRNRDSEAITADPTGRGWWVAFENRHSLWLYDRTFGRALKKIGLDQLGFGANRGVEGLTASNRGLSLFREWGGWFPIGTGISDAAQSPDGVTWLTLRSFGPQGIINYLGRLERGRLVGATILPLGPTDNVEGIAVETTPTRRTRVWLITDNDFIGSRPTKLIALEEPTPQPPI